MWSVPSRLSEPSTATRMFAGLLSRTPGPPPECETMPNFVANTTWSRRSLVARADELLVGIGTVDLGRIDVSDVQVQRPVDGVNRLGVAAGPDVVVPRHRHGAEPYARDVKSADRDVFHGASCGHGASNVAEWPQSR